MHVQEDLKEELTQTDGEFRRLVEEHRDSERRLESIQQKSLPSEADEMEVKRIKLHKLALKDRMEQIARSARDGRETRVLA